MEIKVRQFNTPSFIAADPICIPHRFSQKQDIEIAGFLAAIFAWGNRKTIINKSTELLNLMDNAPYDFCLNHTETNLKSLQFFKHRTFNGTDLLYFISFFQYHFKSYDTLENAFFPRKDYNDLNIVEKSLNQFYRYFFSLEHVPARTMKHIAAPMKGSTCKRLNMFLRWMVRDDDCGVDFGIWKKILPAQLICPIDVHVARVARHFKLLARQSTDWEASQELTVNLRKLNYSDPVKYDFALFGLGVIENF